MKTSHLAIALVVASLHAVGCDGGPPAGGAASGSAGASTAGAKGSGTAAAKKDDAPKATATKLEKLGLTVELPEGSQVSDLIGGGQGHMVVSVSGPFNVQLADDKKPKTVEAAKKDAADFNPKNFKDEKLADGWFITWENEGSMGTNYWMTMRREIGGKAYICDTSVSKPEQRDAAIAACKSLKQ